MGSSRSKRPIYSSEETSTLLTDAASTTDLVELQKTLPSQKILKEGRKHLVRKTKRIAPYWDFYIEYLDDDLKLRAECKFCDKTFAVDSNVNGSKNVKNHSEKCLGNPANKDKDKGGGKQTELIFQQGDKECDDGKLKYGNVNLKDVREALIRMIIIDELLFRFVEYVGFREFVHAACPRFHLPSRTTVARDCLQLYYTEKATLKETLKKCQRISVTTDTWTSIQRINYMCLTAHYVDCDWKLNKKIINFCPISSHKGEAIGKAVEACLESWGIKDRLLTVTVDNASSNDIACVHLRRMVQRTTCVGDGKFLHVRCIAHIINLIVWDGIKEHLVSINRVRNAVKYVKNSPARIARFKDLTQKSNIDCKASLSFDVPTRWNSTYTMLETALKFQKVFSGISLPDGDGLNDNEKSPDSNDWKKVERLVEFLREFYELTCRVSGSHYVTSNTGLFEIAGIYNSLSEWEKNDDLDFQAMAISMKRKFDKYWGNVDKMNMFIYMAMVVDPHCKLLYVELTLKKMYGENKGMEIANKVKEYAYTLFDEYQYAYSSSTVQQCAQTDAMSVDVENNVSSRSKNTGAHMKDIIKEQAKRMKGSGGYVRSEFERYLNEQLGAQEEDIEVLTWWSINGHRFPIVSRMARDVLAIPLSTVASESAFSAGGRHLDPFRSSLTTKTVQALICTQDWLRAKSKAVPQMQVEENVKELEEMEKDLQGIDLDDEVVFVETLF